MSEEKNGSMKRVHKDMYDKREEHRCTIERLAVVQLKYCSAAR